jgi:site-specific DNA recombinase
MPAAPITTQKTLRVAIYTRVSQDSRDARSVAEQETECRAWCDREGWDVTGVWTDNDRSASKYARKARPQWQALTDRLESGGGVDLLVVWEPSRATRDRRVWAALAATCEAAGVRIGCNGRVYDLEDPDDAFQLDLFFALAARESGATSKRVQRSVRANAESGRPHGRVLYGYERKYEPDPSGKPRFVAQLPHPETAPIVGEMARRVLAGETTYAVAQDLNARGVPSPFYSARGWLPEQVKRLCVNPAYAGLRVHRGAVIGTAVWPGIISEADHLALVAKLNDPARRTVRDPSIKHLLSGIAMCGKEGCSETVRVGNNRGNKSYHCRDFHVARLEHLVDEVVEEVMVTRLERMDLAALLDTEDTEARAAADEAAELRDRLTGFYDQAAAGELSPAALARIEPQMLEKIRMAERRVSKAMRSPLLAGVVGPKARELWAELSMPQRREIIRLLVDVRIIPAGRGRRTFDPALVDVQWK